MKEYTKAVLARASALERQEAALLALPPLRRDWRPALAAALAALIALMPAAGAAQRLL